MYRHKTETPDHEHRVLCGRACVGVVRCLGSSASEVFACRRVAAGGDDSQDAVPTDPSEFRSDEETGELVKWPVKPRSRDGHASEVHPNRTRVLAVPPVWIFFVPTALEARDVVFELGETEALLDREHSVLGVLLLRGDESSVVDHDDGHELPVPNRPLDHHPERDTAGGVGRIVLLGARDDRLEDDATSDRGEAKIETFGNRGELFQGNSW